MVYLPGDSGMILTSDPVTSRQEDVPKTLDSWDALLRAVEVLLIIHAMAISNTGDFADAHRHTEYISIYIYMFFSFARK